MIGKIESGQLVTVEPIKERLLAKGDIVLCKVTGSQYLHLVKAIQGESITPNSLIKADALQLLERMESGFVDLVYLDPPWASNSKLTTSEKEAYKSFIRKIIQQAERVLKFTGNVFLYSRPDLNFDFSILLAEVFGTQNFVSEFVIQTRTAGHSRYRHTHETILCYKKSTDHIYNTIYRDAEEDIQKLFPMQDELGQFTFLSLFTFRTAYNNYPWIGIQPPVERGWRR